MSYTFSRRDFFKYSAAAAVAVAGMSLLGGCSTGDANNPTSTAVGTSLATLQVVATLQKENSNKEATDLANGIFKVKVENYRGNPLLLNPTNFTVSVRKKVEETDENGKTTEKTEDRYSSFAQGGVKLDDIENGTLGNNLSVELTVIAPNFVSTLGKLEVTDVVELKYCPITTSQYSGYSMTWRLSPDADDNTDITT